MIMMWGVLTEIRDELERARIDAIHHGRKVMAN